MATATTCDIKTPPTMFPVTGQADRHGQPIITVRERPATQKAVFSDAKGYLLAPERRPFTRQKVTFYKALGNKDLRSRSAHLDKRGTVECQMRRKRAAAAYGKQP